jgi:peptidoglycan L-alanyl-D-glutamate endopeptidase CwlK
MINSQSIDDLRSDVAANVHLAVKLMADRGYPVGVANTVRDNEYQEYLYAQGRTRPGDVVTGSRTTTFHGAGLAVDIFQNKAGTMPNGGSWAYDDVYFWATAAEIFKKLGFSWGRDLWPRFPESCHFQWDAGRTFGDSDIYAGKQAPAMPLYDYDSEVDEMSAILNEIMQRSGKSQEEVVQALSLFVMHYNCGPAAWKNDAFQTLKDKGLVVSDHDPSEVVTFATLGAMEGRRK